MSKLFSTRIDDENPVHTQVTVFNRGGNAGTLCVNTGDAAELIRRIEGKTELVVADAMGGIIARRTQPPGFANQNGKED